MNRSGISNLTGLAGAANIQGEDQKKLDVVSNTVFCNALRASGRTVRHPDICTGICTDICTGICADIAPHFRIKSRRLRDPTVGNRWTVVQHRLLKRAPRLRSPGKLSTDIPNRFRDTTGISLAVRGWLLAS